MERETTLRRETIVFVTARRGISVSFLTCHTFKQTQHIEKERTRKEVLTGLSSPSQWSDHYRILYSQTHKRVGRDRPPWIRVKEKEKKEQLLSCSIVSNFPLIVAIVFPFLFRLRCHVRPACDVTLVHGSLTPGISLFPKWFFSPRFYSTPLNSVRTERKNTVFHNRENPNSRLHPLSTAQLPN